MTSGTRERNGSLHRNPKCNIFHRWSTQGGAPFTLHSRIREPPVPGVQAPPNTFNLFTLNINTTRCFFFFVFFFLFFVVVVFKKKKGGGGGGGVFVQFSMCQNIRILRKSLMGTQAITFNYKEALKSTRAPVYLQPGDTVVVPD